MAGIAPSAATYITFNHNEWLKQRQHVMVFQLQLREPEPEIKWMDGRGIVRCRPEGVRVWGIVGLRARVFV